VQILTGIFVYRSRLAEKKVPFMRPNENIQVSVIIACRNERKYIRNLLDSICRQNLCGAKIEVLVADGMSIDGTRQVLDLYRQIVLPLRVIDNPDKIVSAGLNAAIREARGAVIIRMDAHSEYAPDYICRCLQVLNETNADNVGGPALTRAEGYLGHAIALAYHSKFSCGGAKFHDAEYEGYVDTVPYGCWRKSTLERIGLFDENLGRNQDDELNLRLVCSGGHVWQSPKIISWYRPRASLTDLFLQYFQYGFWKVSVIRKHGRPGSWRHLIPVACLLAGLALLLGIAGASLDGSAWWTAALLTTCVALAGLYVAVAAGAAFLVAANNGWQFLPVLPIVFATYHLSYGSGFLLGLAYRPAGGNRQSRMRQALTTITR
jgi:succinoglycan biosynthesis protein ExoA